MKSILVKCTGQYLLLFILPLKFIDKIMPTTNTTADNLMPNVEQQQQQKIRKKIHWKLLERKNSKYAIIRSSSPNSAKQDLKTFVSENQLQYRRKKHDPLVEFENLFEKLNLNDEELLERADRRDLPAKFQQSYRFFQDNIDYNNKISQPFSNKFAMLIL